MITPDRDLGAHDWPADVDLYWRIAWVSPEPMVTCFFRARDLWPERPIVRDAVAVLHTMTAQMTERVAKVAF